MYKSRIYVDSDGKFKDYNTENTISYPLGNPQIGTGKYGERCLDKTDGKSIVSVQFKKPINSWALSYWVYMRKRTVWSEPVAVNSTDFLYFCNGSAMHVASYIAYGSAKPLLLDENVWHHVYIFFNNYNKQGKIYINGEVYQGDGYSGVFALYTLQVGGLTSYPLFDGKVSDVILWDYARPFTGVPDIEIPKAKSVLYITENNNVYNDKVEKVADNWTTLSDTDKENLFNKSSVRGTEKLRELGKFKIATFTENNVQASPYIFGAMKPQIVLPKDLISIKQVEDIVSIVPTQTVKSSLLNNYNSYTLLHFDGDYVDEFGKPFTQQTNSEFTDDSKFGGKAIKFSANNTIYSSVDLIYNKEDVTVDFWQKCDVTQPQANPTFFSSYDGTIKLTNTHFSTDATYKDENKFDPLMDGNWHHIALVRKDGVFYLYKDGHLVKTIDSAKDLNFRVSGIGASVGGTAGTYIKGIMDEFSVVPYAKWTSDFTPPTEAYKTQKNDIRYAFTVDGEKYLTYTTDWIEIQPDEIPTKGMTDLSVKAITTEKWHKLITKNDTIVTNKLGVAFSLSQTDSNSNVNIDNLALTVNQKGKWRQVRPMDYYLADFVDNETLDVTLNNAGSYKINYALGGD
nr:MAG TPA: Concanavalin A-like lectin/glucanase superfamily protein [Caudoviricetes sp.]